jgi:hypothetical protein
MKTYFIVSLVLFAMASIVIGIARLIFGGDTIVPAGWSIILGAIMINILIAMACVVVSELKGKK